MKKRAKNKGKSKPEYSTPFAERYSSKEMLRIFSPDHRYQTWRKLWVVLAEAERELGVPIRAAQIGELKKNIESIDYDAVRREEEKLKHDVMAHIRVYASQCPKAAPIIHLGATSMYVVDNADLILTRDALMLIQRQLVNVIDVLAKFTQKFAGEPTVAFTHFQPAQFTTVGRRAALWLQDLLIDLEEIESRIKGLRFLGAKGATGTQASFLNLLGSEEKVRKLDKSVAKRMGFNGLFPVTGQTYSRKIDSQIYNTLSGIAESAHKFSNDLRLLQHKGEIQEPFGKKQVGSSAMAYKQNPMKTERMTSLSRLVMVLSQNGSFTAANQWFERTLDDSAGKRIAFPEAFLAVDAILGLFHTTVSGLLVHRDVIRANVERELPFIATENILMEAVKAGGDRQELHEVIRRHSVEADRNRKKGKENDLLRRLKNDGAFQALEKKMDQLMDPNAYVGRSVGQIRDFLRSDVGPVLRRNKKLLGWKGRVSV
ncbi:MAG: adenylosuccinate lyase [Planctomycetota bacterium]|nr:adenylosuccinate lyase [Planctomycetota bacterium]